MKRILFVDDESRILDGLQNLLRRQRKQWHMSFACGGEAALAELAREPFDVIVSDMRMPVLDGAALLRRVQNDYPHVVRIVLSGQTEHDVARRLVHIAHQFLAKPCDAALLQEVIDRACNLQALLGDEKIRDLVGRIGQLPMKPRMYSQLVNVLDDPRASLNDAAAIIERDIGTSAKILQVVNSAFFGLPQRQGSVASAVCYLGTEMVKTLVLSIEISDNLGGPRGSALDYEALHELAMRSARVASKLLPNKSQAEDAFTAAMLQDIGWLVLASKMPDVASELVREAKATVRPLVDVEKERLGVTHAEIGAYLLGIWGLPYPIVEAVANHHTPRRVEARGFDVTGAVHVAGSLMAAASPEAAPARFWGGSLDAEYVSAVGKTKDLPSWQALAATQMAA